MHDLDEHDLKAVASSRAYRQLLRKGDWPWWLLVGVILFGMLGASDTVPALLVGFVVGGSICMIIFAIALTKATNQHRERLGIGKVK